MSEVVYTYEDYVPASVKECLAEYVKERNISSSFLLACLENDLMGAVSRADSTNRGHLVDIMRYIYWELPSNCWGSKEKVAAWLNA